MAGGQSLKRSIDSDGSGKLFPTHDPNASDFQPIETVTNDSIVSNVPEPECKKSNSGYQSPNSNLQAVNMMRRARGGNVLTAMWLTKSILFIGVHRRRPLQPVWPKATAIRSTRTSSCRKRWPASSKAAAATRMSWTTSSRCPIAR